MRLLNMVGYKLFKTREDGTVHIIRIIGMRKPFKITSKTADPEEMTIYDYELECKRKVRVSDFKEYTPLKPDGIFTASIVTVNNGKEVCRDVVFTGSKFLNVEMGLSTVPYCICRQSITDIFYNLMTQTEDNRMVGLAVNQDTCPANFDYRQLFMASGISYTDFINFYRTDTLDDILKMVKVNKFNEVLEELYNKHIRASKAYDYSMKNEHDGWCRNVKTLLKQNNFQNDLNQMLGITDLGFNIDPYLIDKPVPGKEDLTYKAAREDFKCWLSSIYKININEANFLEYDHDINLGDFNNAKYFLFRDTTNNKLYLCVYTEAGEYFEDDLIAKSKEMDFSTKFKIDFYNKYNKDNI